MTAQEWRDDWRTEWSDRGWSRSWRTAAEDSTFDAMVKRRRDFELMLGDHPEELTDQQRARAWELADRSRGRIT